MPSKVPRYLFIRISVVIIVLFQLIIILSSDRGSFEILWFCLVEFLIHVRSSWFQGHHFSRGLRYWFHLKSFHNSIRGSSCEDWFLHVLLTRHLRRKSHFWRGLRGCFRRKFRYWSIFIFWLGFWVNKGLYLSFVS